MGLLPTTFIGPGTDARQGSQMANTSSSSSDGESVPTSTLTIIPGFTIGNRQLTSRSALHCSEERQIAGLSSQDQASINWQGEGLLGPQMPKCGSKSPTCAHQPTLEKMEWLRLPCPQEPCRGCKLMAATSRSPPSLPEHPSRPQGSPGSLGLGREEQQSMPVTHRPDEGLARVLVYQHLLAQP